METKKMTFPKIFVDARKYYIILIKKKKKGEISF